jgi:quercetin dioxygenase-like cupin family protein
MAMNEAQFKQQLQEQGYGEAQSIDYEPNMANDMHTHDFDAFVFILSGEFTLTTEDGEATHGPGETCQLAAGTLHRENAGSSGATILVGRK